MRHADKHIVDAYIELFEGLSFVNKLELIESLSKSLKSEDLKKEEDFYKSFGAFESDKSAEEIVVALKSARNFKDKNIRL